MEKPSVRSGGNAFWTSDWPLAQVWPRGFRPGCCSARQVCKPLRGIYVINPEISTSNPTLKAELFAAEREGSRAGREVIEKLLH